MKTILSYGGGTNSKAIAVEMVRRGEKIDAITFSDTGGEKPETYKDVHETSDWLVSRGYPEIIWLRKPHKVGSIEVLSLEDECLSSRNLPGIAYGFGSCSDKWKMQPFKKWLKSTGWADVVVLIGFDADEQHRADRGDDYKSGYSKRYPLIEWGWGREDCIEAIKKSGLSLPGKSACFFCPSSKKSEVIGLKYSHPDLFKRAVAIEKNADLTKIKGLGRNYSWADLSEADDLQDDLFGKPIPCVCWDGD